MTSPQVFLSNESAKLTYWNNLQMIEIDVGSESWLKWLENKQPFRVNFSYKLKNLTFTARPEGKYWRGYKTIANVPLKKQLGTNDKLTVEKLWAVALHFAKLLEKEKRKQPNLSIITTDLLHLANELRQKCLDQQLAEHAKTELKLISKALDIDLNLD